jgi:outer membrane protein
MRKSTKVILSSVVGGLLVCQSALAADYNSAVGLGVGMAPDYEGSEDYQAYPIVFGKYSYGDGSYVMLRGNQLKWNILNDKFQFGPLLQYRPERDDVDNDDVDRMEKIDDAFEAGFFLTGVFGNWSTTLEFVADVSGEYDGYLVTLGGDYKVYSGEEMTITLGASTTYASDDYMETYFQVDAFNRGTSTLPDYSAGDGEFKDIGMNMTANYNINDRWSVVGNLGYKVLLGDAADSPIVEDEGQFFIGATGVYHF